MPTRLLDGLSLHYTLTGGGPPTLCLVHGSGGSGLVWIRQLEGLADVARVVALDLPGHGESGGDGCRTVGDYVGWVRRFVLSLGPGAVVLGGHSLGGAIAQALALAHPDLVRGLVLVGTGARLRVLPRIFELLASDYAQGCAFVTGLAFSPATSPALQDGARAAMLATRPEVTIGDFRACDAFDVMDRLGEIAAPTLVICGQEDRLTPPKYARHLAETIAGGRLVLVERAGHFPHLEQPEAVNQAIRRFLADLGTG